MKTLFSSFNILTETDLNNIDSCIFERRLKKGEYLIQQDMVSDEIAYIKSGVLRSFYINDNGDEITNCITFEGELMSAYASFITQLPAEDSIQALFDTELIVIKKKDLEKLFEQSNEWQKIGRLLAEMQYVDLEKRIASFQKESGSQRYETMLKRYPNYIKYIPLRHLASFLGVTPRHLSRIRAQYKDL